MFSQLLPVILKNILQILTLWILGIGMGFGQTEFPFFEQSAFDFYRTIILKENPVDKKITIYRYYSDFQNANHYFSEGECFKKPLFKNQIREIDPEKYGQNNIDSDKYELDLSDLDKKQFRIRRFERGKYPKLFLSSPMVSIKEPSRFFVNVSESYDRLLNIYHIEMDLDGKVVDWCKSFHETIVIH